VPANRLILRKFRECLAGLNSARPKITRLGCAAFTVAMRTFLPGVKISTKIFCAFVAMAAMLAALGGYSIYVLAAAGGIVADTYDRPLMAINFARSASEAFTEMQLDSLRRDGAKPAEVAAIDRRLASLAKSFLDDLDVAANRSLGPQERDVIADIEAHVTRWNTLQQDAAASPDLARLADVISSDFDRLIELTLDHAFVERRNGISEIARFEDSSIAAAGLALLFAFAITILLTRRIIKPLSTAARVADRIAGGALDAHIPAGGGDETGILLRSMTVMRDSIRAMMEREQTQRRSAQNRLIDALESSREGMVLVDASGRVVVANSQMGAFFPAIAPRLVEGADFAAAVGVMGPALQQREMQLADRRWVRISRSTTQDGGFFLFISDFTEVKERERRLMEAQEQAEAASHAKSSFLANMSHELRTPLNAIIGFSEIMAGEMFGKLGNGHYLQYSNDILSSGRHLLAIINSVLDLAKSEAGKLEIQAEPVDLSEVLVDCVTMIREQCARGGLKLEVNEPERPVLVLGEAAKLRQVFLNLLSNAMKFTEPGGRVTLATATDAAGAVAVTVGDSGIGMTEAQIGVALAPFGQVDSRLARRYEGTGLGLPIAKALIELHGGTLSIASEPGHGTHVIVTLPLASQVFVPERDLIAAVG
jgi:signal transduction histidine kinase